jgi:glycosyltransferase involved in cell wall biosynthesis
VFPLTVAIIARNEADRIVAAIRSVSFASEILVLDSGSSDETVRIAREAGARVIETDWPGHVEQKNRAIREASHDWILSIDADERVSDELAALIQRLEPDSQIFAGYSFPRLSWWMGRPIRHGTWYPDARIRLFDRRRARWAGRNPHDRVELDGPGSRLKGVLLHHPYRDLGEHLRTIERYTRISADAAIQSGLRAHWWDPALRPYLHLVKAILFKMGFLDGVRGWCLAVLGAAYVSLKWTRIYLSDDVDKEDSSP